MTAQALQCCAEQYLQHGRYRGLSINAVQSNTCNRAPAILDGAEVCHA